jgi:hypothetical protein
VLRDEEGAGAQEDLDVIFLFSGLICKMFGQ